MATVKAIVRSTKKNVEVNIRFRVSDGRDIQLFHSSDIKVNIDVWDNKNDAVKNRVVYDSQKKKDIDLAVIARKKLLLDIYEMHKDNESLTSKRLDELVDEILHPNQPKADSDSFFDVFELYLEKRKLSDVRDKNMRVVIRALQRFEILKRHITNSSYKLNINTLDSDVLEDFEDFLRNEHILCSEYPHIYKAIPSIIDSRRKSVKPRPRGNNTICAMFNKLRAFFRWCNEVKKTKNDPFDGYSGVTSEKYGRPFYITLEERNHIADFDLSQVPNLEVQRDIFIFQCLIGCRVSDLLKMTNRNVNNDIIEYIPRKTKDNQPISVSVPLNDRAKSILEKYKAVDCFGFLLPFISSQKYNEAIKEIFTHCGITRIVTRLNPTTGEEEQRPINEIASSHLARRTFVGNLYKKVQDPNLIGALSGHKEGSKAFARYRDIDEEMKKTLVKMIE